jgi:hypothetical protein
MNRWLTLPAMCCLLAFIATAYWLQSAVGGAPYPSITANLTWKTAPETVAGETRPISTSTAESRLMDLADQYTRPWREWSQSPHVMYSRAGVRPIPPIATQFVWLDDEQQPSDDVLLATIVVTAGNNQRSFPCVMDRRTQHAHFCADGQWISEVAWLQQAPTPSRQWGSQQPADMPARRAERKVR